MIDEFTGPNRFLSNFYMTPVLDYPSVEHFFQAMKTTDISQHMIIRNTALPGDAKRIGRNLTLRPDWEEVKKMIMRFALSQKFAPGTWCADQLLATDHQRLVEGNYWHDNYWGSCVCDRCPGEGQNKLGLMLQRQRAILRRANG